MNCNAAVQCKVPIKKADHEDYDAFLERLAKELRIKPNKKGPMRLFNSNGMELFQPDLQFLKDKEVIYVSQGEDFDVKSYYSEYETIKELGSGGFGKVVLATNKVTKELVAMKITFAESVDSAKDLDMLFNEAQTLKALKHPNIVTVLACFVDRRNKQAVLVMEYLEGGELLQLIQSKERLSENEARDIFVQLVSAIDHCHARKIIHRDLKLENILRVSKDSNVYKVTYS